MLTCPDQRGFVQCDSEDLPTSGVYTAALTIVKANEKFVADLIVVKEYGSAYTTGLAYTHGPRLQRRPQRQDASRGEL